MTTNHTPLPHTDELVSKRAKAEREFLFAMRGLSARAVRIAMSRMGSGVWMRAPKKKMAAGWARGQHPSNGRAVRTQDVLTEMVRIARAQHQEYAALAKVEEAK